MDVKIHNVKSSPHARPPAAGRPRFPDRGRRRLRAVRRQLGQGGRARTVERPVGLEIGGRIAVSDDTIVMTCRSRARRRPRRGSSDTTLDMETSSRRSPRLIPERTRQERSPRYRATRSCSVRRMHDDTYTEAGSAYVPDGTG